MGGSDLLVIVPTRNRPENVRRLVDAWHDTMAHADLVFCVDDDDEEWCTSKLPPPRPLVWFSSGPRKPMIAWTNQLAAHWARSYRFIGSMGDDHVPRTAGWDRQICQALAEPNVYMTYGDDLHQGENLPTACFLRSEIPQALGYLAPPSLSHFYCDNVWMDWGKALGYRYLPEVIIEHMHPDAGKAEIDATYDASDESVVMQDAIAFTEYRRSQLAMDITRIRAHAQQSGLSSSEYA